MATAKIHFNLHKKNWTVREKVDGKWKVTGNYAFIIARPLKWHVGESSRQRVIERQARAVHAWVDVELVHCSNELPKVKMGQDVISYNPYFAGHYYTRHDMKQIEPSKYDAVLFDFRDRYIHQLERI